MLKIEFEYKKGILFARLKGILNEKNSYKINNYLIPVIEKHNIKYLVYNFEYLSDIKESGINAIINSKCILKRNNGKLFFSNINKDLKTKISLIKCKKIDKEYDVFKLIGDN